MIVSPRDGSWAATPEIVAEIVAAVSEHRDGGSPFHVVITGRTQAAIQGTVTALARRRDLVAGGLPAVAGEYARPPAHRGPLI